MSSDWWIISVCERVEWIRRERCSFLKSAQMFISLEKHCSFVQETCTRHTWRDLYRANLWWFYKNSMRSCTWVSDRLMDLPEWFICWGFLACLRLITSCNWAIIFPKFQNPFRFQIFLWLWGLSVYISQLYNVIVM